MAPQTPARLHGPIGLAIGSKTSAEIAVSAMAQTIASRNGVPTGRAVAQHATPVAPSATSPAADQALAKGTFQAS